MNILSKIPEDAIGEGQCDQSNWIQFTVINDNGNGSEEPPNDLAPPVDTNIYWLETIKVP